MSLVPNIDRALDGDGRVAVDVRVAVVIPCRNEAPFVAGVLDAIRAQDVVVDEVIIVDGGSEDGTMDIVRQYAARYPDFPSRAVTAYGANIAAVLNAGISASRSDVIVRMDSHSRPAGDYVRRALQALLETDAAVVGGVWQISAGGPGRVATAIARAVAHPMGAGDAAYRLGTTRGIGRRRVDTVPFGCFRRSHWQQIGGYNEHLLVNEDYEFNYRTRQTGSEVVLDTAIRCEYFARPTFAALARQYFRYGWWKGRMLRQHPRSIRLRQAIPALFLPAWLLLIVLAAMVPTVMPAVAALLIVYATGLAVSGLHAAAGEWRLALPAAAAFLTIHVAWSAGISSFFLTGASATARRQPGGRRPRAGLTGAQLATALAAILLLGVVAPAEIATRLHAARIARAESQVRVIAAALDSARLASEAAGESGLVFVGPGASPVLPTNSGWSEVRMVGLPAAALDFTLSPDPWGNHYVVYPSPRQSGTRSAAAMSLWVLSAGPNGIVDTPFQQIPDRATLLSDDIGVRLN